MSRKIDGGYLDRCFQLRHRLELGDRANAWAEVSRIKADVAHWYPSRDPHREASDLAAKLLIQLLLLDIERLLAKLDVYS